MTALCRRSSWSVFLGVAAAALVLVACGRAGNDAVEPTYIPQPTPDRTMDAVIRSAASPMALGSPAPVAGAQSSPQAAPARPASRTPAPAARPRAATPKPAAKPAPAKPAVINPTTVAPRLPTPKPAVINPTTVSPPRSGNTR